MSLLYVNCSYVVAKNNSKINNKFTCESHTYKIMYHTQYWLSPTTFVLSDQNGYLHVDIFAFPPHGGAWSHQARHMTLQGQKIIILYFVNLIWSLIIGCLQSTFSHPSSSYSHFTMSIGHIHVQLPYFSSFLRFRLHFLAYEINMRLVKVYCSLIITLLYLFVIISELFF